MSSSKDLNANKQPHSDEEGADADNDAYRNNDSRSFVVCGVGDRSQTMTCHIAELRWFCGQKMNSKRPSASKRGIQTHSV